MIASLHSRWPVALGGLVAASLLRCLPAAALTLTQTATSAPYPGVQVRTYTTSSPKTKLWVAEVALCNAGIHIDATRASTATQTVAAWGKARGAKLATNGDFYKLGPLRVYGDAVGEGVAWPLPQTGLDPAYKAEWYWKRAGWIAFLHDGVTFNHTEWQKNNNKSLQAGWMPQSVVQNRPPGVLALVGGFPELVVEGKQVTCSSPTAKDCFVDRGDMRERHPRTAVGLSADLKTLWLVVVDGRTAISQGMYGTELAELMAKLGAWQAFNYDGGGSSQFWVAGQGTINDANGNNNGGGLRAVANHWGVLAGTTAGYPQRPGHCLSEPPCGVVGPGGSTIEESSACFRTFGPPAFWRSEKLGSGGALRWTNATQSPAPDNWAWWRLHLAQGGSYRIEAKSHPQFGLFTKTRYQIRANGQTVDKFVDQSKPDGQGWLDLGTYTLAAGAEQWVAIHDDTPGKVASGQHIVADALRLTRLDPWCGDGACNGGETCQSCGADCGACGPVCGDGQCSGGETCQSCSADCGSCPPSCGDGQCSGGETCQSCSADCGSCPPACGDGQCSGGETCQSCSQDCGGCGGDTSDGDAVADASLPSADSASADVPPSSPDVVLPSADVSATVASDDAAANDADLFGEGSAADAVQGLADVPTTAPKVSAGSTGGGCQSQSVASPHGLVLAAAAALWMRRRRAAT